MRQLVEQENVACVGITTRLRNFYVRDELRRPGPARSSLSSASPALAMPR